MQIIYLDFESNWFCIVFRTLHYYFRTSSAPTTGEDATPPLKKRLLSRSVSSKVQTPNSSPNSRIASPATSRIATMPQGVEKQQPQRGVGAGAASVHTLFATDFFNNVSTGYNVLLHTFQYLKVQVNLIVNVFFFIFSLF